MKSELTKKVEKELHKSRECISCKKLFECSGKPEASIPCLHYEKREQGEAEL